MDEEQLELGSSEPFSALLTERRTQKTISRAELEQKIIPDYRTRSTCR